MMLKDLTTEEITRCATETYSTWLLAVQRYDPESAKVARKNLQIYETELNRRYARYRYNTQHLCWYDQYGNQPPFDAVLRLENKP